MFSYFLSLLKNLFNLPNLDEISKSVSKPISIQLKQIDKKFTVLLLMISLFQILGFIAILSCLENGFHWAYLFKF